jgi:hypothetical protein
MKKEAASCLSISVPISIPFSDHCLDGLHGLLLHRTSWGRTETFF